MFRVSNLQLVLVVKTAQYILIDIKNIKNIYFIKIPKPLQQPTNTLTERGPGRELPEINQGFFVISKSTSNVYTRNKTINILTARYF